jgi:uncharacterized membrane protein (UPF0127 family)
MRRALALGLLLAVACSSSDVGTDAGVSTLVVETDGGKVELDIEVADTPEERATGLMGREDLGSLDGMAFVWPEPTSGGFWMKDTLIPLSIAFWDERGEIVAILDMEPCDADPCPSYDPGLAYVGAVEVGQGAFDANGIRVGDRVELTSVAS